MALAAAAAVADPAPADLRFVPDLVIGGGCAQQGWYANLGGGTFGAVNTIPELLNSGVTHCGDVDVDGDNQGINFSFAEGSITSKA